ncbi:metal ABC transporter ATP-binding protein [Streptococcus halotolerans]|uniref:metal ABC transporter ATP-binding protein n=1 Tax=Streptococcus halotolerans TaxID=1814128 RepID=UPI0007893F66|nr:metal ABC transporter ATP-binding protein [Streptococcus halotolerans]
METAIQIKDLSVSYQSNQALSHLNLEIPKGSRAAIVGPNGAGKSTLFKSLLQLEKAQTGHISLLGNDQPSPQWLARKVAYIPQASQVNWQFPARVFDIVLMGRYSLIDNWFKKPGKKDKEATLAALEKMDLLDFQKRQIDQLSGGQRQRVFLARALAQEADLYLMDEPLAGVDIKTEQKIMDILRDFQKEKKTSVVIHHDLQSVATYFDYLVWLNKKTIAQGTINQVLTEENYQATYQVLSQSPFLTRRKGD